MKPIEDKNQPKNRKKFKFEYLFAVAILIAVILFFFLTNTSGKGLFSSNKEEVLDYATSLEDKLEKIFSSVEGVGKVSVFISTNGSSSEIVLKESEEKVEQGVKTRVEKVVLVNGKPYVISTENPKIIGICVVCEGADNLGVQVKITEILLTTLKLDANCVRIIKMK